MNRGLFWYVTWICLLIILLTIKESQSSNPHEYQSETDEIIAYGMNVFETISKYHRNDENIIYMLRNITNENPRIKNLLSRSLPSILDSCSCEKNTNLYYIKSILKDFDNEYIDFENYLLHHLGERHFFPTYAIFSYKSKELDSNIDFFFKWRDPMHFNVSQEIFQCLVDNYNPMMTNNCGIGQSLNQFMYTLCNRILLSLIKVYSIIIYYLSHPFLDSIIYENSSITTSNSISKANMRMALTAAKLSFQEHALTVTTNATNALQRSSRDIFRRDPPRHIKGVTYASLDYFLQNYVTDQLYLSDTGECTPMCVSVTNTVHYNHPNKGNFPSDLICTGRIRTCTNTEIVDVCSPPLNSTQRYGGLHDRPDSTNLVRYWGWVSDECTPLTSTNIESGHADCNVCACICDMVDSPKSIRYIDLQPLMSNYDSSFVITGIRFQVIDQIVYLQILEGQLDDGKIKLETLSWREIQINDISKNDNSNLYKMDFDNRLFDLTDLTLPNDYAVTMVKFTIVDKIVGLQIEGYPIIEGQLDTSTSKKASNQSTETLRLKPVFQPEMSDIPIRDLLNNSMMTESNAFLLKFETSDWNEDAGQNVVPFIDLQSVVTYPPSPVVGVGMHVRYSELSGGFLAPKLISKDNAMAVVPTNIRDIITRFKKESVPDEIGEASEV